MAALAPESLGRRRPGSVSLIGVFGLLSGCVCVLRNVMDCLGIHGKGQTSFQFDNCEQGSRQIGVRVE